MSNDHDHDPDEHDPRRMAIGMLAPNTTWRDLVATMSQGQTDDAGILHFAAICPASTDIGSSGMVLGFITASPDGAPKSISFGRVDCQALLMLTVHMLQLLAKHDLLKHEPIGPEVEIFMQNYQKPTTSH